MGHVYTFCENIFHGIRGEKFSPHLPFKFSNDYNTGYIHDVLDINEARNPDFVKNIL